MKTALGFCCVDVLPFPKSHSQPVIVPVEVSVKLTVRGKQPSVTSAVKFADCAKACTHKKSDAASASTAGLTGRDTLKLGRGTV